MGDFAYREFSLADIVDKSDNVTSVVYDLKKWQINYKTTDDYETIKLWLDPNIKSIYCNISYPASWIILGETETETYFVITSSSFILFRKCDKNSYTSYVDLKRISFNSDDKDFYINVNYRENGYVNVCVKNGALAESKGYIFEENYTIEVPLIRQQLGFIYYYAVAREGYFYNYYGYKAYEIGGSGSTGLNIDPSKARVTFINKDGNDITLLDTGCLIDTTGFDLSKVVELGEVQVLTDLNLVSQPVTLEIPQEVIPDWVSIGEIEEETIQ